MNPDQTSLLALSSKTGFRPATLEKVIRLGDLLADAFRHPLLSRAFVLKGGTAINLFLGEPRRLSVDLDFNYVGKLDRSAMQAERPDVERAIETIAEGREYRVQRSSEEHGGRKFYLAYRSASETPERIEVDVNFMYRQALSSSSILPMWQPPGLDRPLAAIVGLEELAAGKLVALLDRVAPRDVYDTANLPGLMPESWSSVRFRRIFIALASVLPHPLYSYGRERMARLTKRAIDTELAPMLALSENPEANELLDRAWSAVEGLLKPDDAEKEFIDLVQLGELRPELLFGDDHILAESVRRHPAILWKIENARRRSGR